LAASGSRNSIFATAQDLTEAPPDSFLLRTRGDTRLSVMTAKKRAPPGRDGGRPAPA
jgi:hypothetical protein